MKKILNSILLSCFLIVSIELCAKGVEAYRLTVRLKEYRFSTCFEIDSEDTPPGKVEKSWGHLWTSYYLYDHRGDQQARGVCNITLSSMLGDWGSDISVYRGDRFIGSIDGQIFTMAAAKFAFSDATGRCVAVAYLDQNHTGFEIVDPHSGKVRIASLKRHCLQEIADHWEVIVYRHDVAPEVLRLFAAFIVDRQESWK